MPIRPASRSSCVSTSRRAPSDRPPSRTLPGRPPAGADSRRCDQISSGATGAHRCHSRTTAAARDQGQERKNVWQPGATWVRKSSAVTTPKLPFPAPRSAQNSSASSAPPSADTSRSAPSAVTILAPVRLSQVSP